jgi:hypothetical protein
MSTEILSIQTTVLSTVSFVACLFSLPLSASASPTETALQRCQQRVTEELPGISGQFELNSEQINGTVLIHWRVNANTAGYCRATVEDGTLIEFVNPYAAPRGQRPIETILAFQTADYTVRIVRLAEQLYMNVYNRNTDRLELNRGLVRSTPTEAGTLYTTVLGNRIYQSIVADEQIENSTGDDRYRLVILAGRNPIYDEAGASFGSSRSSMSPPVPVPSQN